MCGSMVYIQFAMAEIRRGKKEEDRRNHRENIMSASAIRRAAIISRLGLLLFYMLLLLKACLTVAKQAFHVPHGSHSPAMSAECRCRCPVPALVPRASLCNLISVWPADGDDICICQCNRIWSGVALQLPLQPRLSSF